MSRLTIKELHVVTDQNKANQKLCDLEDIEEELGIDLITLFKALKDGVYYRNNQRKVNFANNVRLSLSFGTLVVDKHKYKYLTDYGKTWSLVKGDLGNE